MSIKYLESHLNDSFELIKISKQGIQFSLFQSLVLSGTFTLKQWAKFLHLTERSIQRYKKEGKSFEPIQSEKIIEIVKLQKRGHDIFNSSENFDLWMRSKIIAIGGIKPIDIIDSSFGLEVINDELTRIEYGVLA